MKPIIVDMNEMSDSTEVYESKANPFMIYTIYAILLMLVIAVIWMCSSQMEVVVKGNGTFQTTDAIHEVASGVDGKIESCNISDGQYVEEGDVLFSINVDSLEDTITAYQNDYDDYNERIVMLEAYETYLNGEEKAFYALEENAYYDEFVDRRNLLLANMESNDSDTQGQKDAYRNNVNTIAASIAEYEEKIEKLGLVQNCIVNRENTINSEDNYYYTMVSGYLSTYHATAKSYDKEIEECNKLIEDCEETIGNLENIANFQETAGKSENIVNSEGAAVNRENIAGSEEISASSENVVSSEEVISNTISTDGNMGTSVEELEEEKSAVLEKINALEQDKAQALENLELQQIASIQQQIESIHDTITSLELNLSSAKLQLDTIAEPDEENTDDIYLLTEKGNVANELLNYKAKAKECEKYLKNYNVQNNNCNILATESGYIYLEQDIKAGTYVQEGLSIGKIYPEQTGGHYAMVYVDNSDIGKLEEGQSVKFEIAAYPSSEYGYFTGKIEHISKDIIVEQNSGSAFYSVRVALDNTSICNNEGQSVQVINGMACQAKVIVDEESVMKYLLEKIEFID
uniref:HlyD family efflux transporter periplasmic adaptor subunit n=1 Tax=Agathobacter sp. TaxID=2021311 RepID=UPI004056669D